MSVFYILEMYLPFGKFGEVLDFVAANTEVRLTG